MTRISLPQDGSCRCGRVRMRIDKPPMLTMACHCRGCQKMSSSAFSLSAAIPAEGFDVIEGEPVIGGMHGPTRHFFCGHCMTWMFTRPEGADFLVNVRSTLFDAAELSSPFIETYTSTRLPWVTTPAQHSYEKFPPIEVYGELISAYAAC